MSNQIKLNFQDDKKRALMKEVYDSFMISNFSLGGSQFYIL